MGCNGDCYQGRWCDCKDESTTSSYDERKIAYIFSVLYILIMTAFVWVSL